MPGDEKPDTEKKASAAAVREWLVGLTKRKKEDAASDVLMGDGEPVLVLLLTSACPDFRAYCSAKPKADSLDLARRQARACTVNHFCNHQHIICWQRQAAPDGYHIAPFHA